MLLPSVAPGFRRVFASVVTAALATGDVMQQHFEVLFVRLQLGRFLEQQAGETGRAARPHQVGSRQAGTDELSRPLSTNTPTRSSNHPFLRRTPFLDPCRLPPAAAPVLERNDRTQLKPLPEAAPRVRPITARVLSVLYLHNLFLR